MYIKNKKQNNKLTPRLLSASFKPTKSAGFTLVETLVAISIGTIAVAIIMLVMTPGLAHVREVKSGERLHANAVAITDGVSSPIKHGSDLEVPDESTLKIHMTNGTVDTITLNNGKISINDEGLGTSEVSASDLKFELLENSVRIHATLRHDGTEKELPFVTTIAKRN